MGMHVMREQKRMIHYDCLRILAAFSVVMLHSSAQFWYTLPIHSKDWVIANAYDALFRFGVPIFVMLSGALFLGRELDIRRLYTHNILRLVVLYFLWSAIYGIYDCLIYRQTDYKEILKELLNGRYHLWYLPMLIGIYMMLPILNNWVKHAEKRNVEYFLALFLVLKIGITTVTAFSDAYPVRYLVGFFDLSELDMACSYIGYFVLGYYVSHFGLPKRMVRWLYLSVIPAAICNVVLDTFLAFRRQEPQGTLYDSFGFFTLIIVLALFVFFTEKAGRIQVGSKCSRLIEEGSKATLGIYLMHVGALEVLEAKGLHTMTMPIALGIPVMSLLVVCACGILAAGLRRIPVIGRFIC